MWKKLSVMLGVLMLTVTAGYAYFNHEMNAASTFTLDKGTKVVLGQYNGNEVVWDIGNANNNGNYVLMSSVPIEMKTTSWDGTFNGPSTALPFADRETTNLIYSVAGKGQQVAYAPIAPLKSKISNIGLNTNEQTILSRSPFLPHMHEVKTGGTLGLTFQDRAYVSTGICYWLEGYITWDNGKGMSDGNMTRYFHPIQSSSAISYYKTYDFDTKVAFPKSDGIDITQIVDGVGSNGVLQDTVYEQALRPFATVDKNQIVFAADKTYQDGSWHSYKIINSGLNDATENNAVKLRVKSSLTASLDEIRKDTNGKSISKVVKDETVQLKVTANSGNGNVISVLLYDSAGNNIKYYRMLSAPSSGFVALDLTSIPVGQYQVAIINEEYDGTNRPAKSSEISNMKPLEIVEPHQITYTKKPGSGATKGDYEYSKNVDEGQTVGEITLNPTGVTPIVYEIVSDGGDGSYANFEIDGLDSSNASSSTKLNVKIKNGAPDLDNGGLKAGTYKFCITSTDDNGYPDKQIDNKTKVCTSFVVEKTKPTIDFDVKTDTTKTIDEAKTAWNETATSTPDPLHGSKITYTKVGGDIGLIDIDKDNGQVTYQGNATYGKVKIRATLDDDTSTGNDNYETVYTEKEIIIAQEVDGVITPDQASSDTKIPTFKTSDTNVQTGGTIGTIQGVKGTPDQITSGKTTYHYQIKNNPNDSSSYFQVNSTTGKITTNANLSKGEYEFVITVSDKWTSKDVSVKVVVGMAAAEDLKFYENKTSNTVIVKKEVEYTDTNVYVFATVKGSQNTNMVTYKLKDGESTTVIEVHQTSGAIKIIGTGTVKIVAEKEGASGQAKASTELEFTVKASEQKFKYTDNTLANELPKTNGYYNAYKETYEPNKTFYVYTAGYPSGSTVTYQLSADSPQDVISVDLDGKIHILNASYKNQLGKVKVEATSHDPSGNYTDKTIVLPIDIEQGERKVEFKENPINVLGTKKGSVTPDILVDGTLDTETDPAKQAIIEVDAGQGSVAWTNDGKTIEYSWDSEKGKDINLTVTKPADRNYKVATGKGKLHILGADENPLTLSTPGKVTYGDHFIIRSTQNDGGSTNVQYTFETDNGVYISAPDVKGNYAEFDALAYSGSTFINIKVTRTADGEMPSTKVVKIQVLPKPIEIEIDDKEKKRLEENPELTYQDFTSELVEWNGVRDVINTDVIKLTTTAKKTSPEGTYPITAGNALQQLNKNYPNYTFTIKEGKLNIKDNGNKDFWDVDDDGCPDLNIILTDDNGDTILINGDKDEDGIPDYNIDINGDGKPDLNIDTDDDGKPDLNLVILKSWKPSRCVTVNGVDYSSGVTAKAEINIDTNGDNIPDLNIDNKGDFKPHINISKDGKKPQVNIVTIHDWKPGKDYKKGAWEYDSIGDDIKPELNIDTDGDGLPDINLDFDGDGIPELNIDVDGDWIPDMDIDSTGDGKPDVNVDTDGDGEPDGNLKEITEWKPGHNVDGPFPYDTMTPDDPENPDDEDGTDKPDSEVQGSYYPGDNMGGALTGDTTNIILYIGLSCITMGILCYLIFKHRKNA